MAWAAGVAVAALVWGLWYGRTGMRDADSLPSAPAPVAAPGPVVAGEETGTTDLTASPETTAPSGAAAPDVPPSSGPEDEVDSDFEVALRWSAVDLDAVRQALPDSLYWQLAAPTDDPDVLRQRDEERARWNTRYGKVLSGTASEPEIEDYYALRRRISEDAVEFSEYLLDHYGDVLPERDVGLLRLASRLHRARLEEIPRRLAEAQARRQEQDRLRQAWLADEAAFEKAQRKTE